MTASLVLTELFNSREKKKRPFPRVTWIIINENYKLNVRFLHKEGIVKQASEMSTTQHVHFIAIESYVFLFRNMNSRNCDDKVSHTRKELSFFLSL